MKHSKQKQYQIIKYQIKIESAATQIKKIGADFYKALLRYIGV